MKVLTAAQMREIDRRTTEEAGVPSLTLMENAGTRVLERIEREISDFLRCSIAILCGKGNNGGDGFVIARLLKQKGCSPRVLLFAQQDTVKGDAAVNLKRWMEAGGSVSVVSSSAEWESQRESLRQADVVIDAMLGTGLTGPVEGFLAGVISDVNRLCEKAKVIAVDIPSGLSSDTGEILGPFVRTNHTVTFTAPKLCHVFAPACTNVGKLSVGQIGTPPEMLSTDGSLSLHLIEPNEFRDLPLQRKADGHKGDFGHALIVAGSRGKTGAAILAAAGALRSGAGLVTVATPAPLQLTVAAGMPEMMTEALLPTETDSISIRNLDYGKFYELIKGMNALAIGPGLSQHTETQQFVRRVLAESSLPIILDADGLNAFAGRAFELSQRKTDWLAVTPHPGEMARLLGCTASNVQSSRLDFTLSAAADWHAFVILKGYRTIIASPDGRAFINPTGNPGMATGGTGDVLTGILAGLTAWFGVEDWARVLSLGVYLHGLAGDLAAAEKGDASMIAGDLLAALPQAFKSLVHGTGDA